GLATRYDKYAIIYRAAVVLNAVIAWSKRLSDMPYVLLFVTLLLVALMIIPVEYLGEELEQPSGVGDYVRLVWLAASMGTMAGAVGSSLDDSERIRNATYSLRERHRRSERHGGDGAAERPREGEAVPRE
ncbi:hypothetical protein R0J90_04995, partial [Micrococcus sp. SIMBA_144]|nr:hypothetical protein [Micrococcus luteus]MDK8730267.1 hypothetical protein [Micrococcus luteus]